MFLPQRREKRAVIKGAVGAVGIDTYRDARAREEEESEAAQEEPEQEFGTYRSRGAR